MEPTYIIIYSTRLPRLTPAWSVLTLMFQKQPHHLSGAELQGFGACKHSCLLRLGVYLDLDPMKPTFFGSLLWL